MTVSRTPLEIFLDFVSGNPPRESFIDSSRDSVFGLFLGLHQRLLQDSSEVSPAIPLGDFPGFVQRFLLGFFLLTSLMFF